MGGAAIHTGEVWEWAPAGAPPPLAATVAVVLAFALFAVTSVRLSVIDVNTHRLPNTIVLPGYAVGGVLLLAATLLGFDHAALMRALMGMVILFVFYLAMRILSPAGVGGGDVKLAGLIGLHLAWVGWGALLLGSLAGFVLGGMYGLVLIAVRRADAKTAIPFGPFMLGGAWIGILAGGAAAAAILPHPAG